MAADRHIVLGRIGAPHGVRGEVRVKSFTADPMDLGAYGPLTTDGGRVLTIATIRPAKSMMIVRFKEVADRTDAETLTNQRLAIARDRLPPPEDDAFYVEDLIGLKAELPSGDPAGEVIAVHDFGAGDILELRRPEGDTVFLPFTHDVVPTVDIDGGRVVVVPPAEVTADGGDDADDEAADPRDSQTEGRS